MFQVLTNIINLANLAYCRRMSINFSKYLKLMKKCSDNIVKSDVLSISTNLKCNIILIFDNFLPRNNIILPQINYVL